MIPRRRILIQPVDLAEWLRALVRSRSAATEDVARFERAFAEYLGCSFARATASGRDAIELALDAVGVKAGDEIIVPAYTLGELMPLLESRGYSAVPADIDEGTFEMNVDCVAKRIGPKTRAILATHLLGAPCDIVSICELARKHGLAVVEDCAHGLGASVGGRKVGTFGNAAIFSFEVNKACPTYGGGMIVTNAPEVASRISTTLDTRPRIEKPAMKKALKTWMEEMLIRSPFYAILARILFSPKFAARFEQAYRGSHDRARTVKTAYSGFQARLGLRRLARLDDRNARLNRLWDDLAASLPSGMRSQDRRCFGEPAFYNFVALTSMDLAEFRRRAMRLGIDVGIRGEVEDDCGHMLGADDCPVAARIFGQAVLLPLYEGLSRRRFKRLVKALNEIAGEEKNR
jgi:perosamine synthetase